MNAKRKKEMDNDLWFARQMEVLRQMASPIRPDVADAVMQQVRTMPIPMALPEAPHRSKMKVFSGVAAACVAIVVLFTAIFDDDAKAASPAHEDFNTRLLDVYNYCNDYASEEAIECAAYNDNPISDYFE